MIKFNTVGVGLVLSGLLLTSPIYALTVAVAVPVTVNSEGQEVILDGESDTNAANSNDQSTNNNATDSSTSSSQDQKHE